MLRLEPISNYCPCGEKAIFELVGSRGFVVGLRCEPCGLRDAGLIPPEGRPEITPSGVFSRKGTQPRGKTGA